MNISSLTNAMLKPLFLSHIKTLSLLYIHVNPAYSHEHAVIMNLNYNSALEGKFGKVQ